MSGYEGDSPSRSNPALSRVLALFARHPRRRAAELRLALRPPRRPGRGRLLAFTLATAPHAVADAQAQAETQHGPVRPRTAATTCHQGTAKPTSATCCLATRHRRGEPPGPRRARQVPDRPHGRRAGRARRRQHRQRRARLLPDALLAGAPNAEPLPEATLAKIDAYMKQGGMIIFDTKDQVGMPGAITAAKARRCSAARQPRLPAPRAGAGAPRAHQVVLPAAQLPRPLGRRHSCGWRPRPARQATGPSARRVDGVSSILITSNDLRRRLGAR